MSFFRIIITLLLLWLAGFAWFISKIETKNSAVTENADAIVVLTGARGRIDLGLTLLEQGKAKYLFVSGVGQNAVLDDLSKNLVTFAPDKLANLRDFISLGHIASTTQENAMETMEWVRQRGFKSIILVTSNYHMPRSLYMLQSAMPAIKIIPFSLVKKNSDSITLLKLSFIEYNKFLFYRFFPTGLKEMIIKRNF